MRLPSSPSALRHSNLGFLHRFRDIGGFCAHDPTRILPLYEVVSVASDQPCWGHPEHKRYLKLINREIIFEVFQLM